MNDKNRDLNQPNYQKVARLLQNTDNATEEERQIIAKEVQQELFQQLTEEENIEIDKDVKLYIVQKLHLITDIMERDLESPVLYN